MYRTVGGNLFTIVRCPFVPLFFILVLFLLLAYCCLCTRFVIRRILIKDAEWASLTTTTTTVGSGRPAQRLTFIFDVIAAEIHTDHIT